MDILKEPFNMFQDILEKEYNNELTDEFKNKVEEYKENLKDIFFAKSDKYVPFCLEIDKEFEEFLGKYE
jgi:hypothetical protein